MTSQVKIEAFDPSKISLELWLSLLEANFANLEITEDSKKKNILLVSVGIDVFSVLGNICAPDLPHNKTYPELIKLLTAHYIVKPSYHRSLIVFQQRKKRKDESIPTLYADLKARAKDCNFGAQFDPRVRDQLFMAVDHEVYFPNLVAENLDLQKMTSLAIFERILNMEKAFVSEKNELPQVQAVNFKQKVDRPNGSCKHCGFPHDSANCRFKEFACNFCHKKGHLKKVCREFVKYSASRVDKPNAARNANKEFRGKAQWKKEIKALDECEQYYDELGEEKVLTVKDKILSLTTEQYQFSVNKFLVPFEIDSGASVSTLSKDWVQFLDVPIESCGKSLTAYDNLTISVLGKVCAEVQYNDTVVKQLFYVVESNNSNLCGKDMMSKVGIYLAGVNEASKINKVESAEQLLANYSVDSSKPISSITAKIHLKSSATPKFMKARTVPFYHKAMVEDELSKLVTSGIIEPISYSEWAAAIVPVLKVNQKAIRICADFKELNKMINCDRYPLPKIEELLSIVGKGQVFSKIDLQNAYLQIPVDEMCQDFLVINTHLGLFRYKRLPFGLSSSPAIFQRFISQLLAKVEGVASYLDDIIICGSDQLEHDKRLKQVLQLLQYHNVQINKQKSVLNKECIEYLGYHISGEGIKPSPRKLKAIMDAPVPTSVSEVQSFLGMVTYYCKCVKNFSSKLLPLYDLLKKGARFKWTSREQNVFQGIKQDLMKSTWLTNFDGGSPLIIEVDASPVGVGVVLKQKVNGEEKPIYFASKKLSAAELNYSQIDKEGLALVYAVNKFRYFLLGRRFEARTDHKPLLGLFGEGKKIPVNANARIQRWALLLSQYDFNLVHKSGKENVVADALSRLPIEDGFETNTPAEYVKLVESLEFRDISFQTVRNLTRKDAVLSQLVNCLRYGWSDENSQLSEYGSVKSDLTLHNDVVLYRNRVVIPAALRCKILEHLHIGHNGINAMKAEARNWVWWPKMDQDIGEMTKNCQLCCKNFCKSPAPVLSWPCSGKPWSRLHIDYAGPVNDKYFLVIVDSYTKFLDVYITTSTSSTSTIELLRKSFCNFGLPDTIVSDNAAYFVSQEMSHFLQKNGIRHVTPAPYNPSSNGLAERAVRTLKEGLKKFTDGSLNTRICRFLYNHRKTIHSSTGKTPSELMFNRNFRATVESIKEDIHVERSLCRREDQFVSDNDKPFQLGDAVFAKNFGRGVEWVEGKIVEVLGLRNYKVQVGSFGNMVWKRHKDQLMCRYTGRFEQPVERDLPVAPWPGPVREEFGRESAHLEPQNSGVITSQDTYEEGSNNYDVEYKSNAGISLYTDKGKEAQINPPSQNQSLRRSGRIVKPPDRLDL